MPPDWEAELIKRWMQNFKEFEIKPKSKKMVKYCKARGIPINDMMDAINREPMMKWLFVKDPKKQNIYECIAAEYLQGMDMISDFRHLPNRDLLLAGGMLISSKEAEKRGADAKAKSIDFTWKTKKYTVYASHKYTNEPGGAQDNQYRDLVEFIEEAGRSNVTDAVFIAIADGAYYDSYDSRLKCKRIDCLRRKGSGRVFAGRIDDVPSILAGLPDARQSI